LLFALGGGGFFLKIILKKEKVNYKIKTKKMRVSERGLFIEMAFAI
jgi:hypothetical protein